MPEFVSESLVIFSYIFAFFVSLWFGNFITSFYFRIPRGIPLNGKTHPPMCSTCGVKLKYPDYGPLYYYLFKGKSCKICGSPIPPQYFYIELFTATICIITFTVHGVNEKSCLMAFLLLCYILIFLINAEHERVPEKCLWITLSSTIAYFFYSMKFEETIIYYAITNAVVGFIFAFMFQKFREKSPLPEGYTPTMALLAIPMTKGLSILIFGTVFIMSLIFKKMQLKVFLNGMICCSAVLLVFDISFPSLSLPL